MESIDDVVRDLGRLDVSVVAAADPEGGTGRGRGRGSVRGRGRGVGGQGGRGRSAAQSRAAHSAFEAPPSGGGGGGGGGGGAAAAVQEEGEGRPGWVFTGTGSSYSGTCSSCGIQTTVPFQPLRGRPAPVCRTCKAKQDAKRGEKADLSKFVDARSAGVKALHIDALNLQLFPITAKMAPYKVVTLAQRLVKSFVIAARKSGVKITAFIDAAQKSEEAKEKWYSRRTKEMRTGDRKIVQGHSTLLGDLLRAEGVAVHYSIIDNDDTLAAHAYADGASVLSADSDFFRYIVPGGGGRMPPYAVYSDYHVAKDGLLLQLHQNPKKKVGVDAREIISPPPPSEANDPGEETATRHSWPWVLNPKP